MINFANTTTTTAANSPVSMFEVCKAHAKVKFGDSYFNVKPGMVLQLDSSGIIRIFNGYVYDDYCPNLPYWEEGKGVIDRSFMWLDEAPDFVQDVVESINEMSEKGHLYGVYNPNANPLRKRKVISMVRSAGLYSDIPTDLVSMAVSNIKSKDLIFGGAISFEEIWGEEFRKIDGVPSICSSLNGDYTEYITFRSFCKGRIILQSEYNTCELTPTQWRILSRKEYDDKLKYYLSHLALDE